MASLLTRRVLCRSLYRFKEYSSLTSVQACGSPIYCVNQYNFKKSYVKHDCLQTNYAKISCVKYYSTKNDRNNGLTEKSSKKLTLFQKFKNMYRDYWYVLVPVHLVTSAAWFGGFYYLAKSGVDISSILESWNVSERITKSLKDSNMGYIAVSYALYKLATPARYAVTLGGTTVSINYLKKWGYIKPVPSKERIKEMYQEQKDNIIETVRETQSIVKEKKDNIMDSVRETKDQISKKIIDDKSVKKKD